MKTIVTGGVRGIGAAIAEALRARGDRVETLDIAEGADHRLDIARDELPELGDVDVSTLSGFGIAAIPAIPLPIVKRRVSGRLRRDRRVLPPAIDAD